MPRRSARSGSSAILAVMASSTSASCFSMMASRAFAWRRIRPIRRGVRAVPRSRPVLDQRQPCDVQLPQLIHEFATNWARRQVERQTHPRQQHRIHPVRLGLGFRWPPRSAAPVAD